MRCIATVIDVQQTTDLTANIVMCHAPDRKQKLYKPFTEKNVLISPDFTSPIPPNTESVFKLLPGTEVIYDYDKHTVYPRECNTTEWTSRMSTKHVTNAIVTKDNRFFYTSQKTFYIDKNQHNYPYDFPFYTFQSNDEVLLRGNYIIRNLTEQRKVYDFLKDTQTYDQNTFHSKTKAVTDEMLIQGVEFVTSRSILLFKLNFKIVRVIGPILGQGICILLPKNKFYNEVQRFDRLVVAETSPCSLTIMQNLTKHM